MLDRVTMEAGDSALAEDLQVEELLWFSIQSEDVCAVCKQVIRSLEAAWKPENCDHVICIAYFGQYAPETEPLDCPGVLWRLVILCATQRHQGISVPQSALISTEDM